MNLIFKMPPITRREGTYNMVEGHFSFDCKCGNIENGVKFEPNSKREIFPIDVMYGIASPIQVRHTFYMNKGMLESFLGVESDGEVLFPKSIKFKCRSCSQKVTLTPESYLQITGEIKRINNTKTINKSLK